MSENISSQRCVYFSQGQKLTPENLNALNDFSLKRSSLVSKTFAITQGIVEGLSDSLQLEILRDDPMTLRLKTGVAINEYGELLPIDEERLIHLSGIAPASTHTYFILLKADESLAAPYVDEELDNMKSFRYRHFDCRVIVSAEKSPGSVELGRVRLNDRVSALSLPSEKEGLEAGLGVLDQRHAERIRVYNSTGLDFSRHFQMKQSLIELREALLEMQTRYSSLTSVSIAIQNLSDLELEVAESVLAIGRLQVVMARTKRSLINLVEEIRELHLPLKGTESSFWEVLFSTLQSISQARGLDQVFEQFQKLSHVNVQIREHILEKRTDEEKKILIQQSILDLREFRFSFSRTHAFGGCLFSRETFMEGEEIFNNSQFDGEYRTLKNLRAGYEQAKIESQKGVFVSPGKLYLNLSSIDPSRNGILFLKLYKRRGRQDFSIVMNGNLLHEESLSPHESVDRFLNLGIQVRSDQLVRGDNHLVIEVSAVDLDFGLMSLAFYQEEKGVEK